MKQRLRFGTLACTALLTLLAFQQEPSRFVDPTTRPSLERAPEWKLVWSDEFDGEGKPDPKKWSYEHGFLRNNEKQFYTDRLDNVRQENGKLIIEARKEAFEENGRKAEFTSGSIETKKEDGSGSWVYARVEVRAKISQCRGTWPAIWMLGDWGSEHRRWPDRGEIDIMENVGFQPDIVFGTVHTGAYNHVKKTARGKGALMPKLSDDFHVYGIEWSKDKIDFLVDNHVYFTFDNEHKTEAEWPFDKPEYLKLNFAVGGGWGGQKGIDEGAFPQRMEIDWVHVYQK